MQSAAERGVSAVPTAASVARAVRAAVAVRLRTKAPTIEEHRKLHIKIGKKNSPLLAEKHLF